MAIPKRKQTYKGKSSKEEEAQLTEKVRDLIRKGYSEQTIIDTLKIGRTTFFRHKAKVIKDIIREYKPKGNEVEAQYAQLKQSLEDCYRINYQISIDNRASHHDRTVASEMMNVARVQLVRLAEQGYISQPQLPVVKGEIVKIEGQEVKT